MSKLLVYRVSRDEIMKQETDSIKAALRQCDELDVNGKLVFNMLLLFTDAYDDDPRALYDIPEMRQWCTKVFIELPCLFVVLEPDCVHWFFTCLAPIKIVARNMSTTKYTYERSTKKLLFQQIETASRDYLKTITADAKENDAHIIRIMNTLTKAVGPAA